MNTEHVVASAGELADGQMKVVEIHDRTILLVKVDGEYKAYAPECPHHGAPLAEGALQGHRLRCPWHQAVFDARDGSLLEPPSLDRLWHYDVRIRGDDVIVVVPQEPAAAAPAPAMTDRDPALDTRTFAILGAGAAGMVAAETLRREGFRGRIVVLTGERAQVPYDRTELSKRYLADRNQPAPLLREDAFYQEHDIEILREHTVAEADLAARTVTCEDGASFSCDRLLIATGATPRRLGVAGEDLANVFTLRSLADCNRIRRAADGASKAVVVGASFIGMEVAAALRQRGLEVTVVAPEAIPFGRVLGDQIGSMFRRVHEAKGTRFRLGETVERFDGADGAVIRAVLAGGERVEADLAVVGIGVRPATRFVKGVRTNEDASLSVDASLRVCEGVFAAGDVARFPDWRTGEPIRIEHWRLAEQLGQSAARGMLDKDAPYRGVPFFWTFQHQVVVQYVGYATAWDEIIVHGDLSGGDFLATFVRGGRVLAAAGCGRSSAMAAIGEMFRRPELYTLDELRRSLDLAGQPQRV